MFRQLISFLLLLKVKCLARLFFRFETQWPNNNRQLPWNEVRLIVFLNHTSLYEPLFLGILPTWFLWQLSKRMVAPGADKTLNRPLVGLFYKLASPGMVSISRKRDDTWQQFMDSIVSDAIIVIIPEGRMKRSNGLDLNGNKMTVKGGVADILKELHSGKMLIALSGGLHHVHVPGEYRVRLFKTLHMRIEQMDIDTYKAQFGSDVQSPEWRKAVIANLQQRLENDIPG
ncbi:MAG: 1-acyl-sn-glycerol-3-phosphate acyltransferase [Chitinophagales bacterium]